MLADNVTKEIKDISIKSKASVNVNSIIGNLPKYAMIEQNNNEEIVMSFVLATVLKVMHNPGNEMTIISR